MYEKHKILKVEKEGSGSSCPVCDRPKRVVVCGYCKRFFPKMRIRKVCPTHPNAIFLMDLERCCDCHSRDLKELDVEMPATQSNSNWQLTLSGLSESLQAQQTTKKKKRPKRRKRRYEEISSRDCAQSTTDQSSNFCFSLETALNASANNKVNTQLRPLDSFNSAKDQSAVFSFFGGTNPVSFSNVNQSASPRVNPLHLNAAPTHKFEGYYNWQAALSSNPSALVSPVCQVPSIFTSPMKRDYSLVCKCNRPVKYVMCTICGYYDDSGVKKHIPCPAHPQAKTGLDTCPCCGAIGEVSLDEA